MANGRAGNNGYWPAAERLTAVETDVRNLREDVGTIVRRIETMGASLGAEIAGLRTLFATQSQPNYTLVVSIVSVGLLFLGMVGGFAYWPLNAANGELKLAVGELNRNVVTQSQYRLEQESIIKVLDHLNANVVTRAERTERQTNVQRQIDDQHRQIDELRKALIERH